MTTQLSDETIKWSIRASQAPSEADKERYAEFRLEILECAKNVRMARQEAQKATSAEPVTDQMSLVEASSKARHFTTTKDGITTSHKWEYELEHILDQIETRYLGNNQLKYPGNRRNYYGNFILMDIIERCKSRRTTVSAQFFVSRDPSEEPFFELIKKETRKNHKSFRFSRIRYLKMIDAAGIRYRKKKRKKL